MKYYGSMSSLLGALLATSIAATGLRQLPAAQPQAQSYRRKFTSEDADKVTKARERSARRNQQRLDVQARNQPKPPEGGFDDGQGTEAEDQMAAGPAT